VQRLFAAIAVPDAMKAALREVQQRLKQGLAPASAAWTRPEAMHLTLRFLGDVDAARVPELARALRECLVGFGALDLVCEGLGRFPDRRLPRVVWARVRDDAGRLTRLHETIDLAVDDFAPTSAGARFVGHVTLARPKRLDPSGAARLDRFVEAAGAERFGAWRAGEVELLRSELTPTGGRYTTLARFAL